MNYRLLLASILAVFLLGLYIYTVGFAVSEASRCSTKDTVCDKEVRNLEKSGSGVSIIFNAIGGIVSAFAIGFLAINQPNAMPTEGGMRLTDANSAALSQKIEKLIPAGFVLAWLVCGLLAVFFGLLFHLGEIPPLTEMAKSWLGTAVAGVGAFWGIKPAR